MIRVVVAAGSAIVTAGLEALLRAAPEIEVVARAATVAEGVRVAARHHADVVLADVAETGGDGAVPVVLLADAEPSWIAEALRNGVRAVLPRNTAPAAIVAAVQAAAAGLAALHPEDLEALLRGAPRPAADAMEEALTPREIEVLRMLAEGHGNKIVAARLGISEHTVKFHVASILGKLNAGTRTEAVTAGIRRGLIYV